MDDVGVHRTIAVAVGAVLTVLLGGCGTGQLAQTANQVSLTGGAGAAGSIQVRDAQFAADNRRVTGDALYRPGQNVALQLTIINDAGGDPAGPDRLTSVGSSIFRSGRIVGDTQITDGEVLVSGYSGQVASLTVPGAREVGITLLGLTEPLRAGLTYPVELTFARAGTLQLQVPVENPEFLPPRAEPRDDVYPPPEVGTIPGRPSS